MVRVDGDSTLTADTILVRIGVFYMSISREMTAPYSVGLFFITYLISNNVL